MQKGPVTFDPSIYIQTGVICYEGLIWDTAWFFAARLCTDNLAFYYKSKDSNAHYKTVSVLTCSPKTMSLITRSPKLPCLRYQLFMSASYLPVPTVSQQLLLLRVEVWSSFWLSLLLEIATGEPPAFARFLGGLRAICGKLDAQNVCRATSTAKANR